MNELPFIKMHGAGNDYVFVDGFETRLPDNADKLARHVSDRNFGIGADGLVYLVPPVDDPSDVTMKMWNADGSEGAMCGNALRCIALLMHRKMPTTTSWRIKTNSGIIPAELLEVSTDRNAGHFRVDLPGPVFGNTDDGIIDDIQLPGAEHSPMRFTEVSVGNPHAVIFTDELTDRLVLQLGSKLSEHSRFPDGINVEWVRTDGPRRLEVRVWERGSGETLACGSGACAAVAAAVHLGHCRKNECIGVDLPGGRLNVEWHDPDEGDESFLRLSGAAKIAFFGVWPV